MTTNKAIHTFHIPVMGLAYTIDTPVRVAQLGISSAISITDDELTEKMREFFCKKAGLSYTAITNKVKDYRAERITAYLNLIDKIVKEKYNTFKNELSENTAALERFLAQLPNASEIKEGINSLKQEGLLIRESIREFIDSKLAPGSIDVNIMTKVDKENRDSKNQPLPVEYNDAHASLRGFANSTLTSSVILSAGMNPRLYSYFENFPDFYPDGKGNLKKKIILKVSDYRSAMIQGNFLAKKGLWVSEYRIESGLNCGGHAFATDGLLLGPILEEFQQKKEELERASFTLMAKALQQKGLPVPVNPPAVKITVQGGVGTAEEHEFLLQHYGVDSVGWGSPFLLVPEATAVDDETRRLLANAGEDDLYLSHMSPLGVPFNSVRGTSNDLIKEQRALKGRYGSSCPKKYLEMTPTENGKLLCTASRKYQEDKLSTAVTDHERDAITEKSCLCVGLANPAYIEKGIKLKGEQQGVVVCPGPNMAYFTQEVSLERMVRHIYGNDNVITTQNRPHFFIKELSLYVSHLKKEIASLQDTTPQALKKLRTFKENLQKGIEYYNSLFNTGTTYFKDQLDTIMAELTKLKSELDSLTQDNAANDKDYICSKQCATCQCNANISTL